LVNISEKYVIENQNYTHHILVLKINYYFCATQKNKKLL